MIHRYKSAYEFCSGGRLLTVVGSNINSVQKPKMVVVGATYTEVSLKKHYRSLCIELEFNEMWQIMRH